MENVYSNIGIDRIYLSQLIIDKIEDIKTLESKLQVQIGFDLKSHFYNIKYLKIKDNNKFGTLAAGMRKDKKGYPHYYCNIDFSPSNIYGNNLKNMNLNECKSALKDIQAYLLMEYGIHIKFCNVVISKIEINRNIVTEYEYKEYTRLLELICYSISNRYLKPYLMEIKKINKEKRRVELETIIRKNNSIELNVYNKTEQLKSKGIKVDDYPPIMRVEIKLLSSKRIKQAFKTNRLNDLTDEQINIFYKKQVDKYIKMGYEKLKKENEKKLKRLLIKEKANKHWKTKALLHCNTISIENDEIPLVIDINDYIDAVNEIENNGHKARNKEDILEYNKKYIHIPDDTNAKYIELVSKLVI